MKTSSFDNLQFFNDYMSSLEQFREGVLTDEVLINRLYARYSSVMSEGLNLGYIDGYKTILFLGTSGSGKSTLCNILYNNSVEYQKLFIPFPITNSLISTTKDVVQYYSNSSRLNIIDSPGLNDNRDINIVFRAMYSLTKILIQGIDYIFVMTGDQKISNDVLNVLELIRKLTTKISTKNNIIFIKKTKCDDDDPKEFQNYDNNSKIHQYIDYIKNEDQKKFNLLNHFLLDSKIIIECSFANDKRTKYDEIKSESREKSLKIINNHIYSNVNRCKIDIKDTNVFYLMYEVLRSYFSYLTIGEFKTHFQALYEESKRKLGIKFMDDILYIGKQINDFGLFLLEFEFIM